VGRSGSRRRSVGAVRRWRSFSPRSPAQSLSVAIQEEARLRDLRQPLTAPPSLLASQRGCFDVRRADRSCRPVGTHGGDAPRRAVRADETAGHARRLPPFFFGPRVDTSPGGRRGNGLAEVAQPRLDSDCLRQGRRRARGEKLRQPVTAPTDRAMVSKAQNGAKKKGRLRDLFYYRRLWIRWSQSRVRLGFRGHLHLGRTQRRAGLELADEIP
jgi:hypothetical protein